MSTVQNTADTKTGGTPPSGLSEFWFYFSRNKGAVIGLAFFLVILLDRRLRRRRSHPIQPVRASIVKRFCFRPPGSRVATGASCSAPIRSAATFSRA